MTSNPDDSRKTDPDEPASFDPLNAPAPELTKEQRRYLKRKAYLRDYQRKNAHKRNTGRPPGRPPKPKTTEPARPKNYEAVWAPQYREDGTPGPQFALLSCPFPEIFFGGARGGGKALPLKEMVATPGGYRAMGEIKLGDEVNGPGGSVVKVIGVYPQGSEDVFQVTLVDGRTVRASRGHLWRIRVNRDEMLVTTDYIRRLMESRLEVALPVENLDTWVAIKSILYDGLAYTQCIKVDSQDGLFVVNDDIITHNTDGAIGKWLQHAHRYGPDAKGVFFRRRFKQLEEVQARCSALFPRLGATYHKGDANWIFPNGALLKLRHLWDVAATEEYQGHNYCVAEGTPILMADGSYRPIEAIRVGDLVMTLEGPKPVTATVAPGLKACVRAEVFDSSGVKLGEQIHPVDHPVLTSVSLPPEARSSTSQASQSPWNIHGPGSAGELRPSCSGDSVSPESLSCQQSPIDGDYGRLSPGLSRSASRQQQYPAQWQSYTTLLDAYRESQGLSSCPGDDQSDCKASGDGHPEARPLPLLSCPVVLHGPDPLSNRLSQQTATLSRNAHRSPEWFVEPLADRITGYSGLRRLASPSQSLLDCKEERLVVDDAWHALTGWRTGEDSQECCCSDCHPHGGRPPSEEESDLLLSPSRAGVQERTQTRMRVDASAHTGEYTRSQTVSYLHPYTSEHRRVRQPYHVGSLVLQPCGPHEVYDLTVQDANHYVTKSGLVNVNSFLVFEELTNWSTPDAIDRMRGTLRSAKGVPVELIMTGNPGGSGHCVPYGEVLTPDGWKDISRFTLGDPVMTVTPKGELVPAKVAQVHKSRYTGLMATISRNGVTLVCTPNHKIGVVNYPARSKITLKPFDQLGSGFTLPRVLSQDGKETPLDGSGRAELHITADCVKMLDFDGDVYCIGVPKTHSFLIRQNGFVWVSGNSWVKQRYISPAPQGWTPIRDEETGSVRIYIPSRLEDNTAMMKNDPTYAARLRGTGSAALVSAWLRGDWDIVAGGFFDDLILPERHFLTPFRIPPTWTWRRSFDWGSAAPASLGIWAVSDGNPVAELDGFTFPRGSLIRVKEWYTVAQTKSGDIVPNEGLRLTNLALGEGLAQRTFGHKFSGCVADPSIFSKLGRESIYEEMREGAKAYGHNLIMAPADNNRIGGWQKVRDMLENSRADRPEKPGLWIFESCHHWLRTVPVMQRSDTDFDDVDTTQEDHCLHGDTLVETRDGNIPIRHLVGKVGEVRQVNDQYMIFWGCRLTRQNAETITLRTRDMRSVTCTPDHRILTMEGWIEARHTLGKTIVCAPTSTPRAADTTPEVVSIEDAGQHDVYNLEVEHTHAFAVNGGLMVHNCADDTRYACMTGARKLQVGSLIGR